MKQGQTRQMEGTSFREIVIRTTEGLRSQTGVTEITQRLVTRKLDGEKIVFRVQGQRAAGNKADLSCSTRTLGDTA